MLHLIFSATVLSRARKHIEEDDVVLFLEDGCYIAQAIPNTSSFLLDPHAKERGINQPPEISSCTLKEFVHLLVRTKKSISWK